MKKILFLLCLASMAIACKQTLTGSQKYDKLFDSYFEKFPEASMTKPSAEDLEAEREAFMLYNADHLDKSAVSFSNIYKQTNNPRHLFYAGVSALGSGDVDGAIRSFEILQERGDLSSKYMYYYYYGLAHLKTGNEEVAKIALSQVGDNFQYYKNKADALITELNK